jgi:aspartate racemase
MADGDLRESGVIGVLGGMGPAATVDFMAKLIALTPAERDQDHVTLIVLSDPRIPDRVAPILEGRGEDPGPAMVEALRRLERAGATSIAIPCHTAHFWADRLAARTGLPLIHIVDAVLDQLREVAGAGDRIGLLATAATLQVGFYQARLEGAGYRPLLPGDALLADLLLPAIRLVKENRAAEAAPLLKEVLAELRAAGASRTILACTELPIAAGLLGDEAHDCLDATAALARACLRHYRREGAAITG